MTVISCPVPYRKTNLPQHGRGGVDRWAGGPRLLVADNPAIENADRINIEAWVNTLSWPARAVVCRKDGSYILYNDSGGFSWCLFGADTRLHHDIAGALVRANVWCGSLFGSSPRWPAYQHHRNQRHVNWTIHRWGLQFTGREGLDDAYVPFLGAFGTA